MKAKELFMVDSEFLGWVDASGEGVGGGWLPGKFTVTKHLALGMTKEIAGPADNANKPKGGIGYK